MLIGKALEEIGRQNGMLYIETVGVQLQWRELYRRFQIGRKDIQF